MKPVYNFQRKTLHSQVAETLRQLILNSYQPGQKLEGEVKLAKHFGVSPLTLRQALAALTHEGIIQRRHGSGTYVSDEIERPYVAVFSFYCRNVAATDFQSRVFQLCGSLLHERGQAARLNLLPERATDADWLPFYRDVARGRVCGALFIAMQPGPVATVLDQKGIPYIGTGDELQHEVQVDYVSLIQEGTRHLLERGCRRIALMQWNDSSSAEAEVTRSSDAFKAVLAEHNVPAEEKWICQTVHPSVPGAGWEQFRDIWTSNSDKPDGLLVTDDILFREVALGILDSRINVPEQLQVVTHANKGSGLTYPFPVTLMEVDPHEFAEVLTDSLTKLIRKEPVETRVQQIQPRLIPAGARKEELTSVQ